MTATVNAAPSNRRARDPEAHREAQRRWREANPDKVRAYRERRRDAKRAAAAERRAAEAEAQRDALRAAVAPFEGLLESRARALSVTIARAPFSTTATAARHRRSEIRELLAYVRETTS